MVPKNEAMVFAWFGLNLLPRENKCLDVGSRKKQRQSGADPTIIKEVKQSYYVVNRAKKNSQIY